MSFSVKWEHMSNTENTCQGYYVDKQGGPFGWEEKIIKKYD